MTQDLMFGVAFAIIEIRMIALLGVVMVGVLIWRIGTIAIEKCRGRSAPKN